MIGALHCVLREYDPQTMWLNPVPAQAFVKDVIMLGVFVIYYINLTE